jgi:hypothetical protein
MVEEMEPRLLLSQASAAPTLDVNFGTHGYVTGYLAQGVLPNGSIVAKNDAGALALLHPDGTFASNYAGAIPQVPHNVQSDGKYLVLSNAWPTEDFKGSFPTTLTRHLANGQIDGSFGISGTVSDFVKGTSAASFYVNHLLVSGTQIYLAGVANYSWDSRLFSSPAIERLLPSGQIDRNFGFNGVAQEYVPPAPDYPFGTVWIEQQAVGSDGRVYLAYNADNDAVLVQFDNSGKWLKSMEIGGGADHEVDGLFPEPGNKLLMLFTEENAWSMVSLDTNIPPDIAGTFGPFLGINPGTGMPDDWNANLLYSTLGHADVTLAQMWQRDDGKIIISGKLTDRSGPGITSGSNEIYTFAVNLAPEQATASASGRIYNDVNANGKLDVKEAGLPWWQVYADLNNNGVFDAGEPTAFTNAIGEYTLNNLPTGKNIIREVRQDSCTRTQPAAAWPAGFYSVTLSANQQWTGLNFGNAIADHRAGSISSVVYNDYNGDQTQDNGEKGLAGWQVYADTNDNGIYDMGEPIATTNSTGHFTITGLQQGGYRIREIRKNGWVRMQPFGDWPLGYYDAVLTAGQSRSGYAFGNAFG